MRMVNLCVKCETNNKVIRKTCRNCGGRKFKEVDISAYIDEEKFNMMSINELTEKYGNFKDTSLDKTKSQIRKTLSDYATITPKIAKSGQNWVVDEGYFLKTFEFYYGNGAKAKSKGLKLKSKGQKSRHQKGSVKNSMLKFFFFGELAPFTWSFLVVAIGVIWLLFYIDSPKKPAKKSENTYEYCSKKCYPSLMTCTGEIPESGWSICQKEFNQCTASCKFN